jgi:hypothetical protein
MINTGALCHAYRRKRRDFEEGGAEGQTRTVDTGIFSAVLYHLSYLGQRLSS